MVEFRFERGNFPDISYRVYSVRKKNGKMRIITAPNDYLKDCQYEVMRFLSKVPVSEYAHGFVEGRSIVTNALNHTNKKYVLNIDLKDFFPSVKRDKVGELFNSLGLSSKALDVVLREGCLPQGSPCSPVISNLICLKLDCYISEYAKERELSYSRYADDITLSGDNVSQSTIDDLYEIIYRYGLVPNKEKTIVLGRHKRQVVTGLVVNEGVNISRTVRRKIRAMKHQYDSLDERERQYLAGMNGIEQMIVQGGKDV